MDTITTTTPNGFGALGLHDALVEAASALGYEEPTAIQREAIPPLLQGRDVLGQAATGTGKTAAFALPMLHLIGKTAEDARRVRGLILVPTRELAMQVAQAVHKYGRLLGTSVLPVYGGQSVGQQLRALKRGVDVVVATPGRALDHINRGTLDLSTVRVSRARRSRRDARHGFRRGARGDRRRAYLRNARPRCFRRRSRRASGASQSAT